MKKAPLFMWTLWKQDQTKLPKAEAVKKEWKGQRGQEKAWEVSHHFLQNPAKKAKLKKTY